MRQGVGRALSYAGKLQLLKTAASRPEWQNAAWAATLALNTTMRGCEIKQLRWRDIDLMEKTLAIRKSKIEAGERVIPLNTDAWNTLLLSTDALNTSERFGLSITSSLPAKLRTSTLQGHRQAGALHGAI